jgi:hypothetical protein
MTDDRPELDSVQFYDEAPRAIHAPRRPSATGRNVTRQWRWALGASVALVALQAVAIGALQYPDVFDRALFRELFTRAWPLIVPAFRSPISRGVGVELQLPFEAVAAAVAAAVLLVSWLLRRKLALFAVPLAGAGALACSAWTGALFTGGFIVTEPVAVAAVALLAVAYSASSISILASWSGRPTSRSSNSKVDRWIVKLGVLAFLASPWIGQSYWGEPFQTLATQVTPDKAAAWRLQSPFPANGWLPIAVGGAAIVATVVGVLLLRPPFRGRLDRLGQGATLVVLGAVTLLSGWPAQASEAGARELASEFRTQRPNNDDLGAFCAWWSRGDPARTLAFTGGPCDQIELWQGQQLVTRHVGPFPLDLRGGMLTGSYATTVVAAGHDGLVGVDWQMGEPAWSRGCDAGIDDVLFSGSEDPLVNEHRRTVPRDGQTEYVAFGCGDQQLVLDPTSGGAL